MDNSTVLMSVHLTLSATCLLSKLYNLTLLYLNLKVCEGMAKAYGSIIYDWGAAAEVLQRKVKPKIFPKEIPTG